MTTTAARPAASDSSFPTRVTSIDALRGLVMFTMIFVNDLAGVSHQVVPWWMRHFKADGNGMTFVDLVFPAFLFIVGMSIPLSLGSRLNRAEPVWKILFHVLIRTLSLLLIGILMVNESPDSAQLGWSANLWSTLMYLAAILAFGSIAPPPKSDPGVTTKSPGRMVAILFRFAGFLGLAFLACAFRGRNGERIISLSPFFIHTSWYGILGLIGWAYLVACIVFFLFRENRTALLGCMVLLMCMYPAARTGTFDHFWLNHLVGMGETLGSQGAITVGGMLLASILITPETADHGARAWFTLLFVLGCVGGALLLHGLYGINKNSATPSWCLWACAITGALWLLLHLLCESRSFGLLAKPLAIAGSNVLLAYLISEMLPSALDLFHLGDWFSRLAEANLFCAVARSAGCGVVILVLSVLINRAGFRLKL